MAASSLTFVQNQIIYYGATTLLVLSSIGNACIVLIFSRNRRNPCSMYLIAAAVMNTVILCFNTPTYLYTSTYGDPTANSLIFCKLRFYLANVWGEMSRYFMVFACIDRYALTSGNARVRAFSRPSVALRLIGISIVVWHVVPAHILILLSIMDGRCGAYGPYFIFYSVYNLAFTWLIPCATMITFGYMAYSNIKRLHTRVQPIGNDRGINHTNGILHRRDRDLFIMVLIEAIAFFILAILYPCILAEVSITNYITIHKSPDRLKIEGFIYFIAQFLLSVINAMPFYVYLGASKAFRNDCKKFVSECWRRAKRRTTDVHEMTDRTMPRIQTNI
jgi:hypothetical protein